MLVKLSNRLIALFPFELLLVFSASKHVFWELLYIYNQVTFLNLSVAKKVSTLKTKISVLCPFIFLVFAFFIPRSFSFLH